MATSSNVFCFSSHESAQSASRSSCWGWVASCGANSRQSGEASLGMALGVASIPRSVTKICWMVDGVGVACASGVGEAVIRRLTVPVEVFNWQLGVFELVETEPPGLETNTKQ